MAFFRLQRSSVNKWCWRKSEQHFSKFWFIYCCYSLSYTNLWHHQFWERKVTLTPPAFSNTLAGDQHCRRQNTVPAGGHACGFLVRLKHLVHLCELSWSCRPAWLLPAAWSVFPFTPCFVPLEQKAAWTGWYPVGDNYPQGTESDQLLMCPTLGQHQLMLEHPKSYSPCACPALQTEVHGPSASHEGLPTPSCVLFVRLFVLFVYLFSDTNYFQVSWTPATQKATQLCYHP